MFIFEFISEQLAHDLKVFLGFRNV